VDVENQDNAEIIYINQVELVPGKESNLEFTIHNVGKSTISNLKFSWTNDDGVILPVGSDNTKYVSSLDVNDDKILNYDVFVDSEADPGLYQLDLVLSYDDESGSTTEISTVAGIYIGGETDFDVAFSESSGGSVSFSVANTGANPAYSVTVKVPEQEGWTTSGTNSFIIGNLNKGDYTIASFDIQKVIAFNSEEESSFWDFGSEDVPQPQLSNVFSLEIDYTDTSGERVSVSKELELNLVSSLTSEEDGTSTMPQFGRRPSFSIWGIVKWVLILFVLFIVGFSLYYKYYLKKSPYIKAKDLVKKLRRK